MDFKNFGRAKYNELFIPGPRGDYIYVGPTYELDMDKALRSKLRLLYALLAVVMAGAFILAGFISDPAARKWYLLGPYAFLFLPLAFTIKDMFWIIVSTDDMNQWDYDKSVVQLKRSSLVTLGLSAFSFGGCIFSLIFTDERLQGGLAMISGSLLIMLSSGLIAWLHPKIPIKKHESNVKKTDNDE